MDTGSAKRPRRPTHLPDYAEACLQALADHGMGKKISLGGALGLLHYLDYRPTHDVDAWWAIGYNDTDAGDVALFFVELGGPVDMSAGSLTVTWNVSGIATLV